MNYSDDIITELVTREFLDQISVNIGNISNYDLDNCIENVPIFSDHEEELEHLCIKTKSGQEMSELYIKKKKLADELTSKFMSSYLSDNFKTELKYVYDTINQLLIAYQLNRYGKTGLIKLVFKGGNVINMYIVQILEHLTEKINGFDNILSSNKDFFGYESNKKGDWDFSVQIRHEIYKEIIDDVRILILIGLTLIKQQIDRGNLATSNRIEYLRKINVDLLNGKINPSLTDITTIGTKLIKKSDRIQSKPGRINKRSIIVNKVKHEIDDYLFRDIFIVSKILDTSSIKISDLNILTNELSDVYIVYVDDIRLGNAVGSVHFELFRLKISNFLKLDNFQSTINCPIELIDVSVDYYDSSTLIETTKCIKKNKTTDSMDGMLVPSYQYVICDLLNLLGQSILPWDDIKWRKRLDRLSLMLLYHLFDQPIEQILDDMVNISNIFDHSIESSDELLSIINQIIIDERLNSEYINSLVKIYRKILIGIKYFKNETELSEAEREIIMPYIVNISLTVGVDGILNKLVNHYYEYINSDDNMEELTYFNTKIHLMIVAFKQIINTYTK